MTLMKTSSCEPARTLGGFHSWVFSSFALGSRLLLDPDIDFRNFIMTDFQFENPQKKISQHLAT